MSSYFGRFLDFFKILDFLRSDLKRERAQIRKIFQTIDFSGVRKLFIEDFERFLAKNSGAYTKDLQEDLGELFRRCDIDMDGTVSFKDFYIFFTE